MRRSPGVPPCRRKSLSIPTLTHTQTLKSPALDSSVKYFRALFRRAGLRVVAQRKHLGFPGDMLPVYMYALVPDSRPDSKRITRAS